MIYVKTVHEKTLKKKIVDFNPGDTLKVYQKIKEGEKSRIQVFMGTVIARNNKGIGQTFTVRKISFGTGVERVFPLYSPNIDKIEVVKRGKVARTKLYYLRDRIGKKSRVKEKTNRNRGKEAAGVTPEAYTKDLVVENAAVQETPAATSAPTSAAVPSASALTVETVQAPVENPAPTSALAGE